MLRNILILVILYAAYVVVRRLLGSGGRRSAGSRFTSRSGTPGKYGRGAVDAEFEELDEKDR